MCGIVGYAGTRNAPDILLAGLKRLEYRGYDSAGLAVMDTDGLSVLKVTGKVKGLADKVGRSWSRAFCAAAHTGIAHTRWATHGAPTEANAHPHLDDTRRIALVHNGIVENYAELRHKVESRGHVLTSGTDTEVLVHLIADQDGESMPAALRAALEQVEGTFGLAMISLDQPNTVFAARRSSPLVIGLGDQEHILASDPAAIVAHTRQVVYLDDGDVAILTPQHVEVRDTAKVPAARTVTSIDPASEQSDKGDFSHFMLKEIFDQPRSLRDAVRGRLDPAQGTALLSGLRMPPRQLLETERIVAIGCGTSLHAGMVGEYFFEDLAGLPADVEQAAEFRYRNPIITPKDLVLAISQSGETADTLAALREAKQKGAAVAGLCNVVGSTLAREAGRGVYIHAGPEIGVAATKAFTGQVAVLALMALKFARCRRLSRDAGMAICKEIEGLPAAVEAVLEQDRHIARVAERYAGAKHAFFIGRGYLYPVALESALKLKEVSYVHAEGYHAAELKHGPIALLDHDVPVIALANDVPGKDKTLSNMEECRARKAPVVAVRTRGDDAVSRSADEMMDVPRCSALLAPVVTAVALQLFAFHVARHRGCDIDQPRNLAKSVTVE